MEKEKEIIYRKYLERLRVKLIAKYDELGLRASGKYEEALEGETTRSGLIMWGSHHSWYMENGRRPGKFPPRKAIEEWIEVKQGLPPIFKEKKKQFAFLIARKIAREGISVPNAHNKGKVIESVITDFLANDIYEMIKELGDVWVTQIKADVIKLMRTEYLKVA